MNRFGGAVCENISSPILGLDAGNRLIPYKASSPVGKYAVPTLSLFH